MTMEDPSLSLSSLDSRDSVSGTYHRAAKLFLNKQFPASLNTLRPVLEKPAVGEERLWTKIWNLYIALLNNAMVKDADIWGKQEQKKLSQRVSDGKLWTEVETAFGGIEGIPEDVMISLILISHKHCINLSETSEKIENYLSSGCGTDKVIEMYVMRILTKRGEFEYAQEVVECNPNVFRDRAEAFKRLKELEAEEKHLAEEQEKERKRLEEQEQKRVEEAIKSKQQKEEKISNNNTTSTDSTDAEDNSGDTTYLKPVPPQPTGTPPNSFQQPPHSSSNEIRTQNFSSLVRYWKNYFVELFKNGTAIKGILFFLVIILSVTNPIARSRIKRALAMVWQKLAQTIQMGTKVSYV